MESMQNFIREVIASKQASTATLRISKCVIHNVAAQMRPEPFHIRIRRHRLSTRLLNDFGQAHLSRAVPPVWSPTAAAPHTSCHRQPACWHTAKPCAAAAQTARVETVGADPQTDTPRKATIGSREGRGPLKGGLC